MYPLYAHCPHCGFPVVVNGVEAALARRCRQCRGEYTPGVPLPERRSAVTRRLATQERQRVAQRARAQRRRGLI